MDSIPSKGYDNLTTSIQEEDYHMEITHLPEIDDALLMQLLDDAPSTDECENERLDFVIRSLEAEIGSDSGIMVVGDGESMTGPNDMDSDDGGLGGINFDFDKYDESRLMIYDVGDDGVYAWKEMDMATVGPTGSEFYVSSEDEELEFEKQIECYNFSSAYNYVGEYTSAEQVFSPLWQ
jgi:hypothetical protein